MKITTTKISLEKNIIKIKDKFVKLIILPTAGGTVPLRKFTLNDLEFENKSQKSAF
jgi:hypothetical protein